MLTVKDIPEDTCILITDLQDMESVLDSIGHREEIRYYGFLLVELDESTADYTAVYGSVASMPRLTAPLDLVWPTETL